MKTIIAGSRTIQDLATIEEAIQKSKFHITSIVSGGAKGVDTLAETWAKINNVPCQVFPADWKNLTAPNAFVKTNSYGKYNALAGMDRNKKMAKEGDALIAIWDGKSTGTKNMIDLAYEYELDVFVYNP